MGEVIPSADRPSLRRVPTFRDEHARAIRTTLERFELKYWVTEPVADAIVAFAAPYLEVDPFSTAGGSTRAVSLYLDRRGLHFLEQHVSGAPDRSKLRVRAYGDPPDPDAAAFFEVKRKVKSVTLKKRATLRVADVRHVLRTGYPRARITKSDERKHLDDFIFLQRMHRAEPQVLVAAYREAFQSRITGDDVRMTIDREIVYQPARGPEIQPRPRAWVSVPGPDEGKIWYGKRRALIELKFRGSPPRWMCELVARLGLRQEAFSKYVSAMIHMRGIR